MFSVDKENTHALSPFSRKILCFFGKFCISLHGTAVNYQMISYHNQVKYTLIMLSGIWTLSTSLQNLPTIFKWTSL